MESAAAMWDATEYTHDENVRWSWLRAVEWIRWPYFISQPIVPVMLLFWPWQATITGVLASNLLWFVFVRPHSVSLPVAKFGACFVRLKWVVCPITSFYLFNRGATGEALLALLWPVLIAVIPSIPGINLVALIVIPTSEIGPVQMRFMAALGYELGKSAVESDSEPEAKPAPGDTRRAIWKSTGMEFVFIPTDEFLMGSASQEAYAEEEPQHLVPIKRPFWLGKFPVTQDQWESIMEANPSSFSEEGLGEGTALPVEQVSWHDAQRFLSRLNETGLGNFRLPTEEEWEYAARGGTTEDPHGTLEEIAWYDGNSGRKTRPVGLKKANAWGLPRHVGQRAGMVRRPILSRLRCRRRSC